MTELSQDTKNVLNHILRSQGIEGGIDSLIPASTVETVDNTELEAVKKEKTALRRKVTKLQKDMKKLEEEDKKKPVEVMAVGTLPQGKMVWKPVREVFPDTELDDFDVPYWEWDGPHPYIPHKRTGYKFRDNLLAPMLYSFINNERGWLQGHTGSGKTTLPEQMCAHMNWPFVVVSMDARIERSQLMGKQDLVAVNGVTETKWRDGILPQAMKQGVCLVLDELSFADSGAIYCVQRVTEGESLRLLENDGELVYPASGFRLFATCNTKGSGDVAGQYIGARPQSIAFLNRFTTWLEVPYLNEEDTKSVLEANFPSVNERVIKKIAVYTKAHQTAFIGGEVSTPFTLRSALSMVRKTEFLGGDYKAAWESTVGGQLNEEEMVVAQGIANRCF